MNQPNSFQNTAQWYSDRLYHFTSSELHNLLGEPKSKADLLPKKAKDYIFDKLAEDLTAGTCIDYNELNTKATRWGHTYEPEARKRYEAFTLQKVDLCGFIEWSPIFGGSPDGLVGDDGGIEIKCPYNSSVHARYLLFETPDDLKKEKPEYYAQIQGNMLVTGRKWFDFISYDPRVQNPDFALKILFIPRDEEYIDQIRKAIDRAEKYKEQILSKLVGQCI